MRICIEMTPIGLKTTDKGGVYRYIERLIESLGALDRENEYILFANFFRGEHYPHFLESAGRLRIPQNFSFRLSRFPTRLQRTLEPPAELLAGRFDVFHGCFDYLRPTLWGRGVVTVHDLRYLEKDVENRPSPEERYDLLNDRSRYSGWAGSRDYRDRSLLFERLRKSIRTTCRRADIVITVSEFTARRIVEILGISSKKIRVIPHGVDPLFRPRPESEVAETLHSLGIRTPYVLYVGKFDPDKNLARMLEAFRDVARETDVRLVLAGPPNWYQPILRAHAENLGISGKVHFTGFVSDELLARLYSGASVFAFPSLYEGFGLPLLEAMSCGSPVVASSSFSIPEVVGNAAEFVDPTSAGEIRDGILKCLTDATHGERLSRRGLERARLFSWEDTARKTLSVYREASGT